MTNVPREDVTFIGECGKKLATLSYNKKLNLFNVVCEETDNSIRKETRFFRNETDAQLWAEYFAFGEKNGNE